MSTETLPLQRYSLSGATMGTRYSAVFYAAGEIDQAAIQADLQQAVEHLPARQPSARAALELDVARRAVRKRAAISLDLNGIAKGFAVDQLARCLEQHGIHAYLVGIDGEMRAAGIKADGSAWLVALEKPLKGRREVLGALELHDTSIATSGDYRHWRERDGSVHSHTMDPHSGVPLVSTLTSVSVICTSCMYADAWATALLVLVLGVERGSQLAKAHGLSAIFVLREGDTLREVTVGL